MVSSTLWRSHQGRLTEATAGPGASAPLATTRDVGARDALGGDKESTSGLVSQRVRVYGSGGASGRAGCSMTPPRSNQEQDTHKGQQKSSTFTVGNIARIKGMCDPPPTLYFTFFFFPHP